MSITINGATNTLTAASGLTIAGNTTVSGTFAVTEPSTFTQDASATNPITVKDTAAAYATNDNYIRFLNSTGAFVGAITHPAITSLGVFGLTSVDVIVGAGLGTTRGSFSATGLAVTGTLSASGVTSVTDTTDATSTTSASLKTAGGLGVVGSAYFGGRVNSALFRTTSGQVVCTATVQSGDLYTISRGATIFDINCYATGAALQTTALISSDGTNHTLTILKPGASTVLAIVGDAIRVTCASNVTLDWNALRIA